MAKKFYKHNLLEKFTIEANIYIYENLSFLCKIESLISGLKCIEKNAL